MSGIDDLEAMAGGTEKGGEPPSSEQAPVPVPVRQPAAVPRRAGGLSARDVALQGLSPALREQVIADAAEMGIRIDNDLSWLLVGAQVRSWAAAASAGAAAEELSRLLESLPQRMLDGARLAGGDVAGEIRLAVKDVNVAILQTGKVVAGSMSADVKHVQKIINEASVLGADKIKNATDGLIGKLDAAVEQKKEEGVQEWANLAAEAGVLAARSALGKVALRGGLVTMLLLVLGILIGGGGLWAARKISGDYLPAGVQTFQSPVGSDFIRIAPGRATVGNAIRCGGDICIPVVPAK